MSDTKEIVYLVRFECEDDPNYSQTLCVTKSAKNADRIVELFKSFIENRSVSIDADDDDAIEQIIQQLADSSVSINELDIEGWQFAEMNDIWYYPMPLID